MHVSVHMYDYDHTCVTGVRCFIDVSRNTEIKKMEREREREKNELERVQCRGRVLGNAALPKH